MSKCEYHPYTPSTTCRVCKSFQGPTPLPAAFTSAPAAAPKKQGIIPIHGDKHSFNLSTLIRKNMYASRYFNDLMNLSSFNEVIAELETHCKYVEPWTIGTTNSPSTLFCCLYRIFHFKVSEGQMKFMLEHANVYVRCLGAMYLRIVGDPAELWPRLKAYLTDTQTVSVSMNVTISFGEYVEQLLSEQSYYGVQLPRIPVLCQRELAKLCLSIPARRQRFAQLTATSLPKDTRLVVYLDDGSVVNGLLKHIQGRKVQVTLDSGEIMHVGLDEVSLSGNVVMQSDLDSLVKQREVDRSLSDSRSDYSRRPQSYKSALSLPLVVGTKRTRSRSPSPVRDLSVVTEPAEPSAAQLLRLDELKRKYCEEKAEGQDLAAGLQANQRYAADVLGPETHHLG